MLLKVAFILLLFAFLEKGVHGQCSTPPINQAVYEGTLDTLMTCNRQVPAFWQVLSTSDELTLATITNSGDTVDSLYASMYGANQTGLTIKKATTIPGTDPFATAGLYIIKNTTAVRRGAKLLVVREGPTCSCNAINSTTLQLNCSIKYADSTFHPIKPVMNWTSNGNFYTTDTPQRSRVDTYWFVSTSTITADANVPPNYQCTLTFAKPTDIQYAWVATNAPSFSASCIAPCVQCLPNLKNIAVYEGELNTLMNLATAPGSSRWTVKPTTDELENYRINEFGGSTDPSLTGLYDVTQAGLIIKNATTTENGNPLSTAGLYIAECANNTNKTGAKLLVVREGPLCSCNSTSSTLSCSVTYGDSTFHPIYPRMTWIADGVVQKTETPPRMRINPVFVATSTISFDGSFPATYECEMTFAAPTDIQIQYIVTNAPEFNASCSIAVCGLTTTSMATTELMTTNTPIGQCLDNLQSVMNVAVYEGQLNTLMNLPADPQSVTWRINPTSDELSFYYATEFPELFDITQDGLIIKNATTTTENGNPISTAGLYIAQCANATNRTGGKLLVVRSGPDCSCNETSLQLSCTIIYADSIYHPIKPIVRWIVNGIVYLTETLQRKRIDQYVFEATSTITVNDSDPTTYSCEMTFDQPTDIQFPFLATNAPDFNESCTTSGNVYKMKSSQNANKRRSDRV